MLYFEISVFLSSIVLICSLIEFACSDEELAIATPSVTTPKAPSVRDLHRANLARKGIAYKGTKFKRSSKRSTHCYSCKKQVSSDSSLACAACGWLICNHCGTCGCGRR